MKTMLQVFHDQEGKIEAVVVATADEMGRFPILKPRPDQLTTQISGEEYADLGHDEKSQQKLLDLIQSHRVDMTKTPAILAKRGK
jgi:hypothetical protein